MPHDIYKAKEKNHLISVNCGTCSFNFHCGIFTKFVILCCTVRERSYADAVEWYETVVNTTSEDDSGEFDATMDDPVYQLQAAMAQLYLVGGYGLEKDPSYAGMSTTYTC